jgi:hypothetical protein
MGQSLNRIARDRGVGGNHSIYTMTAQRISDSVCLFFI